MRKPVILPLAFLAITTTLATACSFRMRAGDDPNAPTNQPPPPQQPPPPAQPVATAPPPTQPAPVYTGPVRRLGKRKPGDPSLPTPTPTNTSTAPAPTTAPTTTAPPPATGPAVVSGATIFGGNTVDGAGFKGSIFFIPAGTTKLPSLATLQPNGFLFTKTIDVKPQAFTTGFPGVDANRKENFAIRYEAPLVVTAEADYDFRIVADDGAKLLIDNTPIVDNDGARAAPAEKSGPVHLIAGTHVVTVDYLQTTGNVALQVFCKKANEAEKVCPTQL